MSYQLPPDLENAFSLRAAAGPYNGIEEVLRQALSAFDARNREVAAIQEGIDAMERGDTTLMRDFDRQFRVKNDIAADA
jgi:predicted transcriptional regulator